MGKEPEQETYIIRLLGGPMDGNEKPIELNERGSVYDDLIFAHPVNEDLSLHYTFEAMYGDGSIDYIYVRDFPSQLIEDYVPSNSRTAPRVEDVTNE